MYGQFVTKIKFFTGLNPKALENEVNYFMATSGIMVVDVKYKVVDRETTHVMVFYNEQA